MPSEYNVPGLSMADNGILKKDSVCCDHCNQHAPVFIVRWNYNGNTHERVMCQPCFERL